MSAFDAALKYATNQQQFKVSLRSFQLVQEQFARMAKTIQAMLLCVIRLTKMSHERKASLGLVVLLWNEEVFKSEIEVLHHTNRLLLPDCLSLET